MLFNEFVAGTGCRETDHNYQVYKELEIIYMNTDCTKEHIYEMGKKLVDNSKTEEEIRLENKWKEEIEELKEVVKAYEEDVKRYKWYLEDTINTIEDEKRWNDCLKNARRMVKKYKGQIKELKWMFA